MRRSSLLNLIALGSLLFFLLGNAALAITDPVESNYVLTAKEMVQSGNWISPQIFSTYWYDKPIFIYWLLSLSYSLFGFTDFASRLPGAVFGMGSVVFMAWYMLRRGSRWEYAVLAAIVTATSFEVWIVSHSIITDQMLFFFTAGTLFFAWFGLTEGKGRFMTAAYAMAALAVLTKGPVGIVLPGTFLLVFAGLRRNLTYIKRIFQPAGILLFCVLCLPWYVTMYNLHGMDFINGFLGLHNIARATASEHPEANVWYYYVALIPVSLLPWTGAAIYAIWKRRCQTEESVYLLVWAAGTFLFYTLVATKYPTYTYIANIPLLLFASFGLADLYEEGNRRLWTWVTAPAICWWLLFFAATFFLRKTPIAGSSWLLLYLFVPLAILLVVAAQRLKAFPAIPLLTGIATAVVYLVVLYQGLAPFYAYRSAAPFIGQEAKLPGRIYFFEDYRVSFTYYTGLTATYTAPAGYDENKLLHRSSVWAGKHPFPEESSAALQQRLRQGEAVTILVPSGKYEDYTRSEFYPLTRPAGKIGACYVFYNL